MFSNARLRLRVEQDAPERRKQRVTVLSITRCISKVRYKLNSTYNEESEPGEVPGREGSAASITGREEGVEE